VNALAGRAVDPLPDGNGETSPIHGGFEDAVAVAGLLLLVLTTFWYALPPDRVFFERDIGNYWYPQVQAYVRALAEGAWPVWSPRVGFGEPMWSDPGYQVAYPFTWLNIAFLPWTYYKLYVLAHTLGTMLGLYAFARTMRLRAFACFAGAVVWGLSGPFLSATNLNHHFGSAAWIPAVLFALARALRSGTGIGLLAAAAALQMLAGSGDVVMMTSLLGLAYAASFVGDGPASAGERLLRTARIGSATLLLATALSAAQWLPTASLLSAGSRLGIPRSENLLWSVHPLSLVDLVVPRLVADLPLTKEAAERLGVPGGPFLATLYLGVPALVLALLALRHPARGLRLFACGTFAFFLLLALGGHTPILPALLALKPFALFRYPSKYLFAAAVACGALAALGTDKWLGVWQRRDRLYAACVAIGLAALALSTFVVAHDERRLLEFLASLVRPVAVQASLATLQLRLSDAAWLCGAMAALVGVRAWRATWAGGTALAAVALLTINLVGIGRTTYLVAPAAALRVRPRIAAALADVGGRRIQVEGHSLVWLGEHLRPAPPGWDEFAWSFLGTQERLAPPTNSRWGIDGSFDADFTGLSDRSLTLLTRTLTQLSDPNQRTRLLQIAAVDHVVALREPSDAGLREVARAESAYSLPIRLYAVPDPLPRAYVVGRGRPVKNEEALQALLSPSFDFRREVLLAEGAAALEGDLSFQGSAAEVERRSDRVVLDVQANAPALLVLVENFGSGWHASIDGASVAVSRANAAFRAVRVPAGHHRVEMRYRPASVLLGLAISVVAVIGLLGWTWAERRRSPLGDWPWPR
jgi:hypothetical protein